MDRELVDALRRLTPADSGYAEIGRRAADEIEKQCRLREERDIFIVNCGLWQQFVDTLPARISTAPETIR